MGPALAAVLAEQLSASVTIYPYRVNDFRAARLSNAARVLQGYFTKNGTRFDVHSVVEDLAAVRNVKVIDTPVSGQPLVSVPETIAKQLDKRTRRFGTTNPTALSDWGQALSASDPETKTRLLQAAIKADPNFGMAYVELAEFAAARGDREQALAVTKEANDHLSGFTDVERARMELVESGLRENLTQRREALMALSRLVSTDARTIRTLAELDLQTRRYDSAIDLFQNALAIEPDNPALWNELGYAQSYAGNLSGAKDALERYRALQPKASNPLDSLGEVHFFAGQFAEADRYFLKAREANPDPSGLTEVLKAAQARYMQGKTAEADALFAQVEAGSGGANNPLAAVRKAEWLYVTGRAAQAIPLLESAGQSPNPEIAAFAQCHLAMWALDSGDRARAADLAGRALAATRNGSLQRTAALLRAVSLPGSVSGQAPAAFVEWVQAYDALFSKDFERAAQLWKPLYERSPPTNDGNPRTMYAWALSNSGKRDAARPLLSRYFIPLGGPDDPLFATHAFVRFLELRAQGSGSTGKTQARR
jgi:tetratricopeptide (TPR) repeat protein